MSLRIFIAITAAASVVAIGTVVGVPGAAADDAKARAGLSFSRRAPSLVQLAQIRHINFGRPGSYRIMQAYTVTIYGGACPGGNITPRRVAGVYQIPRARLNRNCWIAVVFRLQPGVSWRDFKAFLTQRGVVSNFVVIRRRARPQAQNYRVPRAPATALVDSRREARLNLRVTELMARTNSAGVFFVAENGRTRTKVWSPSMRFALR